MLEEFAWNFVLICSLLLQDGKEKMATPIIQNMAYFLLFFAKVMKKSHWLGLDAAYDFFS